jgi:hypothetical protein
MSAKKVPQAPPRRSRRVQHELRRASHGPGFCRGSPGQGVSRKVSGITDCGDVGHGVSQARNAEEWVRRFIDRLDARDTNGWLEVLGDDARFCFGNAPPVAGRSAIRKAVTAFFSAVSAVERDIMEVWTPSGMVIFRAEVGYARLDGSTLTIPFENFLKLDDNELVGEYLNHADTSKLRWPLF